MSRVQAIERAFVVLGTLGDGPLGVTEVAARARLPKSTVARMLAALVAAGAVEQVPGGTDYRVGGRMATLAAGGRPTRTLVAVARPHLVALAGARGRRPACRSPMATSCTTWTRSIRRIRSGSATGPARACPCTPSRQAWSCWPTGPRRGDRRLPRPPPGAVAWPRSGTGRPTASRRVPEAAAPVAAEVVATAARFSRPHPRPRAGPHRCRRGGSGDARGRVAATDHAGWRPPEPSSCGSEGHQVRSRGRPALAAEERGRNEAPVGPRSTLHARPLIAASPRPRPAIPHGRRPRPGRGRGGRGPGLRPHPPGPSNSMGAVPARWSAIGPARSAGVVGGGTTESDWRMVTVPSGSPKPARVPMTWQAPSGSHSRMYGAARRLVSMGTDVTTSRGPSVPARWAAIAACSSVASRMWIVVAGAGSGDPLGIGEPPPAGRRTTIRPVAVSTAASAIPATAHALVGTATGRTT